jgi:hypothetical protein
MPTRPRIAIIGAGPIGLEAALYARLKGYEVTVFERREVANHVRQWGHVRMFSPFGMNSSAWGRETLSQTGITVPESDALLSGDEYVEQYLLPLSRLAALEGCLRDHSVIWSICRRDSLKTEKIGDPRRAEEPFRLSLQVGQGQIEAEVVLDCSGTFAQHNNLGAGGVACPGEFDRRLHIPYGTVAVLNDSGSCLETNAPIEYRLPQILSPHSGYGDCTTLIVGGGYSAATNVVALSLLQADRPQTRVIWLTKQHAETPVGRIPNDRLAERDRLAAEANRMALSDDPVVTWRPGRVVRRVELTGEIGPAGQRWAVHVQSLDDGAIERIEVDRIIANVGYRPDRSLYEELQVHECYATQGPMKLAAKLMGETSADCLDQTSHGPEVLRNPEPNFYILGMKSYGRRSNFLIQVGLQQIVDVFTLIEQDWGLSLLDSPDI